MSGVGDNSRELLNFLERKPDKFKRPKENLTKQTQTEHQDTQQSKWQK